MACLYDRPLAPNQRSIEEPLTAKEGRQTKLASQAECRGFDSHRPLQSFSKKFQGIRCGRSLKCCRAILA